VRIVAALGGNALLERGEKPDADIQEHHVQQAVDALAPLARAHDLIVTHGNGPQVGMLALESARDPALTRPYSLDVLGAQTQGMIGYWLVRALRGAVPGKPAGCLVGQTRVDPDDPAFTHPAKFVGPVYQEAEARDLAAERGWTVRRDGAMWRRVVPSPEPLELVELPLIQVLLAAGALVVCAGGGGIPVVADASGALRGVEAVVDKDLTAAVLARAVNADVLLLLTDVDAVTDGFGTLDARPVRHATPSQLRARSFPAGSMGPKAEAACRFVEATGRMAAIGRLDAAAALLRREAGTIVSPLPSRGPERQLVPVACLDELLSRAATVGVSVDHDAAQVPDSWCVRCDPFGPSPFLAVQVGFCGLAGGEEEPARGPVTVAGNRDHAGRVQRVGLELLAADAARTDDRLAPVPAVAGVVDQLRRLPDDRHRLHPAARPGRVAADAGHVQVFGGSGPVHDAWPPSGSAGRSTA
jgi:carbamate kinase